MKFNSSNWCWFFSMSNSPFFYILF